MPAIQTPQSANLHLQIIWVHAKDVINESEKELTILKLLQFQLSSIISPLVSRLRAVRARRSRLYNGCSSDIRKCEAGNLNEVLRSAQLWPESTMWTQSMKSNSQIKPINARKVHKLFDETLWDIAGIWTRRAVWPKKFMNFENLVTAYRPQISFAKWEKQFQFIPSHV